MASRISTERTDVAERMDAKIGSNGAALKKATLQSACIRLHQLHGESPQTWENRMSGDLSDYKQVGRMNRALIDLGLSEKVGELMAVIDASLMGESVPPLFDAIKQEQGADREEDGCEDAFMLALAQGAVPVAEAKSWIRRSATARLRAEQCEAAVRRWLDDQEAK